MDGRKRAGWVFWFSVVASLFVGYVLMLGPACWFSSRWGGEKVVTIAYRPVTAIAQRADSRRFDALIRSYSEFGAGKQWHWMLFTAGPGEVQWRWEDVSWYSRFYRRSITKAALLGTGK